MGLTSLYMAVMMSDGLDVPRQIRFYSSSSSTVTTSRPSLIITAMYSDVKPTYLNLGALSVV